MRVTLCRPRMAWLGGDGALSEGVEIGAFAVSMRARGRPSGSWKVSAVSAVAGGGLDGHAAWRRGGFATGRRHTLGGWRMRFR